MMKRRRKLSCNLNLEEDTTESLTSVLWHKRARAYLISLIRSVCNSRCSFSRLRLSPLSNPPRLFPSQAPSVNYAALPASSRRLGFLMHICRQHVRSRTKFLTNGLTRILSVARWRGPVSSAAFSPPHPSSGLGASPTGTGLAPRGCPHPRLPRCCRAKANSPASPPVPPGASGLVFGKSRQRPWEGSGVSPLPGAKAGEGERWSARPAGCSTARLRGGELAHRLTPRPPGSAGLGCPARSAARRPAPRQVGAAPVSYSSRFIPTDCRHLCNRGRLHPIGV